MRIRHIIITLLLLLTSSLLASAQHESRDFRVDFRIGGTAIPVRFAENQMVLQEMVEYLQEVTNDPSVQMVRVSICGATSPEGSHERNTTIAQRRLEAMEKYLLDVVHLPDELIQKCNTNIPFPYFKELVDSSTYKNKEAISSILSENQKFVYYGTRRDGKRLTIDQRILKLSHLDGGAAWKWLDRNIFPELRYVTVQIHICRKMELLTPLKRVEMPGAVALSKFVQKGEEEADVAGTRLEVAEKEEMAKEEVEETEEGETIIPEKKTRYKKDFKYIEGPLTVKTNGIGWMMLIANVAAEYQISDRVSVNIPFYYSGGINYFWKDVKFRGIVLQPEVRYHFKKVSGLYMGAHAGIGWYNFALNGNYRIQDTNYRPAIGGGLGLGYKFRFPHLPHWGMEFNLGAGAYDARYDKFYNEPNGALVEGNIHKVFIGIDNATVSVTYNFGKKIRFKREVNL